MPWLGGESMLRDQMVGPVQPLRTPPRVSRRAFAVGAVGLLSATGLLALSNVGKSPAHTAKTLPLVGFVSNVGAADATDKVQGLRDGLREQGLIENENIVVDWRYAEGNNDLLPGFIAELVSRGVQVIVAMGGTVPRYVRQATDQVPLVALNGGALVTLGFAESYSRPGGKSTGLGFPAELASQAVETLTDVLPYNGSMRRLGYRAADYTVHILNGTPPGVMPIEVLTDADLVINRTTAERLGIGIPPAVAAQVTEWVQ